MSEQLYYPCCEHCGPGLREGVRWGYGDGHKMPCEQCHPPQPAEQKGTP